ncbi:hypothetical protein [Brachybacterium sp. NPDC056505]|uniref:hypothetical protein n=1 Tax=Brachybacterium sp. NPDC056505 TaxID=3345843 RepID=UPI00366DE2EF
MTPDETFEAHTRATSNADSLGLLALAAVAEAAGDARYCIIGGYMVRMLQLVYPTPRAVLRSTRDADAAVESVEVIGPIAQRLQMQHFEKKGGNLFTKQTADEQEIEINVLMPRSDSSRGIRPKNVPGLGQVDTLPELTFALSGPGLAVDVTADLLDGSSIEFRTRVPRLEVAAVLKAHSWKARGLSDPKDLADLHSLMEVRQEHPEAPWRLDEAPLHGYRLDGARLLHELAGKLTKRTSMMPVPSHVERPRMAALIAQHIARP